MLDVAALTSFFGGASTVADIQIHRQPSPDGADDLEAASAISSTADKPAEAYRRAA